MKETRPPIRLAVALGCLMAVQAVLGLLFPAEYRDVAWIAATWWGNDWVTLLVGVPLLAVAVWSVRRGSGTRGRLFLAGAVAYAVYNYTYYLLGAALNRFFALYLACLLLATAALIVTLVRSDAEKIASDFRERTPVRSLGGYYLFVSVGLSAVWLGTWFAYAFGGRPTPVSTEAFKLVAALDMTLMVPVMAIAGVLLWQRRPWGYVIAAFSGIQATLYLLVLSVNSYVQIARGLAAAPGELPIWGTLLGATATATFVLLANVRVNDMGGSEQ